MKQPIFGGARSGKGIRPGTRGQHDVVPIATATADDEGMAARIARPWTRRPA